MAPTTFYKRPPEPAPKWAHGTCIDCEHFDAANDQCGKWKAKPPLALACAAQRLCPDYDEKIPF